MSIFIHDCIESQQKKHINRKLQTATKQTFSETASYFNYRISMDTKGPINPPSNQNSYIHVIVDAFSHFVVTVPIKKNNSRIAANSLLHHWTPNLDLPYVWVQIVVQNILILNLQIFALQWELDIHQELRTMDKWFSRKPK